MPDIVTLAAALLLGLLYDPERKGLLAADPAVAAAAAAGCLLVAALFGLALHRRFVDPPGRAWTRAYFLFRYHPIALYAAAVHLFHWPVVAEALGVSRSDAAVSAILLLPFLSTLGVVWAWAWRIEGPEDVRRGAWLGFHFRSAALVLLTFFAFASARDLLSLSRTARVFLRSWSVAEEASVGAVLALLAFLLPLGARRIWKTRPLEAGALRDRLAEAANRLSFRCRDLLEWDTAGLVANAAVVGFLPRWRYVVFTDALLATLRPGEVEAVFGHEVGHAARRHVATSFALGGAWALAFVALSRSLFPNSEEASLLLLAPFAFLGWLGYGWLSRRFELEADLYGAAAVGDVGTFVSALERANLSGGPGRRRSSWRHFSVGSRVAFLSLVAAVPEVGERFRARLRRSVRVGVAALVVVGSLHVWDLARKTPGELGWAWLRLGDYARAERLLARTATSEEKAREGLDLARFARGLLEETGPSPDRVVERTRRALEEGDLGFVGKIVALVEAVAEGREVEGFVGEAKRLLDAGDGRALGILLEEKGALPMEALSRDPG